MSRRGHSSAAVQDKADLVSAPPTATQVHDHSACPPDQCDGARKGGSRSSLKNRCEPCDEPIFGVRKSAPARRRRRRRSPERPPSVAPTTPSRARPPPASVTCAWGVGQPPPASGVSSWGASHLAAAALMLNVKHYVHLCIDQQFRFSGNDQ